MLQVTGKVELSPHLSIGSDKDSDKWAYGGYAARAAQNDIVTRAPVDDILIRRLCAIDCRK